LRAIRFTKMQGLGNDFIVVEGPARFTQEEIEALCDRRRGVGADGVLVVTRVDPIRMEYWNADGSAAEMCGNGLRCVARWAYDRGWAPDRDFSVQTPIGERRVRVHGDVIEAELGRIEIGEPRTIGGVRYADVRVGNPHVVAFTDDVEAVDLVSIGGAIQSEFESGVNVEFASIADPGVRMRVWERGVGETLACGTGMAAVAAVAMAEHGLDSPLVVEAPGGRATIDIREGVAWMTGPAVYSFTGSVGEQ
jgi:diaminopimelate epimerase